MIRPGRGLRLRTRAKKRLSVPYELQLDTNRDQDVMRENVHTDDDPGFARSPHFDRLLGAGDRAPQTCHDTPRFETCRVVVDRQDECVLQCLLDSSLLLTLGRGVVTG